MCGNICASGECMGRQCTRVAFVTSEQYAPHFMVLGYADARCQELSEAAGLPGEFVAFLSDSETDARDRVPRDVRYARVDGELIVETLNDYFMTTSELEVPVSVDELGNELTAGPEDDVWTGSTVGGTADHTCNDWTGGSVNVRYGSATYTTAPWISDGAHVCNDDPTPMARFYCFQL
jgi:hypothetical protein